MFFLKKYIFYSLTLLGKANSQENSAQRASPKFMHFLSSLVGETLIGPAQRERGRVKKNCRCSNKIKNKAEPTKQLPNLRFPGWWWEEEERKIVVRDRVATSGQRGKKAKRSRQALMMSSKKKLSFFSTLQNDYPPFFFFSPVWQPYQKVGTERIFDFSSPFLPSFLPPSSIQIWCIGGFIMSHPQLIGKRYHQERFM